MSARGSYDRTPGRAYELQRLFDGVLPDLMKFIRDADDQRTLCQANHCETSTSLVKWPSASPALLEDRLQDTLRATQQGSGPEGLSNLVKLVLENSVNTTAQGFLDKLYSAPLPPGIIAECVLAILNTNLHIFKVSPVLSLIEKHVAKDLAALFGLCSPRSGGISVQGGSASNLTSIVIARNTLFPETKTAGNSAVKGRLVLLTSAHGHYSTEKAAQALGLGKDAVIKVPVDKQGRMNTNALAALIQQAKLRGQVPFYICATAGTTVLGAFDPFLKIAKIAREHRLWFHVDAAWGGGFVFSGRSDLKQRLAGVEAADTIATNPQKMLGVPLTCSFLLGKDMMLFEESNTLRAGYLFHEEIPDDEHTESGSLANSINSASEDVCTWREPYDLGDLTLQCGRRGDSLKFFLCWQYYGTAGYMNMVDNAYGIALHLSALVRKHQDLTAVLDGFPPSCLQVCFYYTPGGHFVHRVSKPSESQYTVSQKIESNNVGSEHQRIQIGKLNTRLTACIARRLIGKGFMVDYAPALDGQEEKGSFFRIVINISTVQATAERLVYELVRVGDSIADSSKVTGASG